MATTDQAICIRIADYSETSQVVRLLTRESGVVRLLAKGSKRPKSKSAGRIDLFAEGRCVFGGAGRESLGTLMEFAETASRGPLRADLDRLHAGLYMLELCGALLAEDDPHPEVFDLLRSALGRLDEADSAPPAVLAYFQYRLLRHVGLLGKLESCVRCGGKVGPRGVYFSSSAGGLLCRNCEPAESEKYAVAPAALAGLAALAAAEAGRRPEFPQKQARGVNDLLAYHVEYQIGRRLRTGRYVRSAPR
jgi:DNA repair protein RecO (recombination protein O)